ncbi:CDP-glycerol glycerophosphotransferase family protein [Vibrio hepatarius]|uniref:CDP-glycerol glycerophosphotransferase family protein n=1 Tax=Vibrio hepatarius TaxID=171383 RepID=UPI001C080139|nr:CDP-glycerol glycerophosphotransferase family protein [Vibrio hepatarius]MBU2895097.1 CDP-glycerol glycerophosphotransferase family protein [Vibrio hepatarius]
MTFFRCIRDAISLTQLEKNKRRLIFYSEGENYWPHLKGLVLKILEKSHLEVCYISSSEDDPGYNIAHPRLHAFLTDEGFVRNWLFENIDTDVMVMTMPDLHQYQIKRSIYPVHYIYVQHSLVSLHSVYRFGAFDFFDTIFCAGPHHVQEIRSMEKKYNLPAKDLVEHGYARLDDIINESNKRLKKQTESNEKQHYLIAPSWGKNCIIESGLGYELIEKLLNEGNKVTLRPHPQTIKFAKEEVYKILEMFKCNDLFSFERNVAGQDSLHESDVMISDWSGAALDYALGLKKPVIFFDSPQKINNEKWEELHLVPLESSIRNIIGIRVGSVNEVYSNINIINEFCVGDFVFNVSNSNEIGSDFIIEKVKTRQGQI